MASQQVCAPGAHSPRNHRDAIQQIEGAFFKILARNIFESLPTREPAIPIDHLHVSRDRADFFIGKVPHEQRDRIGSTLVSASMETVISPVASARP